jgi:hypothetical protein
MMRHPDALLTWEDFYPNGTLRAHLARWEELSERDLTTRSIATLKARGDYDPERHPDATSYPPLTLEERLELQAISEAIARYVRHPAEVHRAAMAGATWVQMGQAVGQEPERVLQDYQAWANGQRHLRQIAGGELGLTEEEFAEAIAKAGGADR